jgi:hypothetical protein
MPRSASAMLDDAAKRKLARIALAEVQTHHAAWSMAQQRFEVHCAMPILSATADADALITEIARLATSGRSGTSRNGRAASPASANSARTTCSSSFLITTGRFLPALRLPRATSAPAWRDGFALAARRAALSEPDTPADDPGDQKPGRRRLPSAFTGP